MGRGLVDVHAEPCGLVAITYDALDTDRGPLTAADDGILITAQEAWAFSQAIAALIRVHDLRAFVAASPWALSGHPQDTERNEPEYGVTLRVIARERDLILRHMQGNTVEWVPTRVVAVLLLAMPSIDPDQPQEREVSIPLTANAANRLGERFASAALASEQAALAAGFPPSWAEAATDWYFEPADEDE